MAATTPREIGAKPGPINFELLSQRFGMTRQDVYALALMEAIAQRHQHRPRQVAPGKWETDSFSEPGEIRHQWQEGQRLFCDCRAATGDPATGSTPRVCSHTAAVHMALCDQLGIPYPVRPMSPDALRYDPSLEAKAALKLIEYPRKPKAQPAEPAPALVEAQP
ncbi:MAG TPA: hypothetical protein VKT82_15430 [Ktedonobacterales bacterium]|nr:hypothetical protein [Ktedonobacterales bacterium]